MLNKKILTIILHKNKKLVCRIMNCSVSVRRGIS
nr:MAG TPA: hypothetical protein [Caudoviricetes sp.]